MTENSQKPQSFVFYSKIGVGEIKESTKDGKAWWYYTTQETTDVGTTHRIIYHSFKLKALEKHREDYINRLKEEKTRYERCSFSASEEVKPTLIQRFFYKENEKIR